MNYIPAFCCVCGVQIFTGISAQIGAGPMPTICTDCNPVKK